MPASPRAVGTQPPGMLPCSHHTNTAPRLGSGLRVEFCHLWTLQSKLQGLLRLNTDIACDRQHRVPPLTNPPAFLLSLPQSVPGARTIQTQAVAAAMPGSGSVAVVSSSVRVVEGHLLRAGEQSLARSSPDKHLP